MKDMNGFEFNVGCKVARAVMYGRSPYITICTVTDIRDGKLYLDKSKQPILFPDRLLIVDQDPLYRIVQLYDKETKED